MGRKFRFKTGKDKEKQRLFGGTEDIIKPEHIGGPHIEMYSNRELTLDGCAGVLEYRDTYLRLKFGRSVLTLCGRDFDIVLFDDDVITVRGYISSLEFEV